MSRSELEWEVLLSSERMASAAASRLQVELAVALRETAALRAERDNLVRRLESIIVRCEEGDNRVDWLPTIASIARGNTAPTKEAK